MSIITLHALPTDTLLHAEPTAGEKNSIYMLADLADENGATLADENGDILAAFGEVAVIILHALPTDTLIHAEGT